MTKADTGAALARLMGKLAPAEVRALHYIAENGDVIIVADQAWLLTPAPKSLLEVLAAVGAITEDLEEEHDDEPGDDDEPDNNDYFNAGDDAALPSADVGWARRIAAALVVRARRQKRQAGSVTLSIGRQAHVR
jgi:hypothetical protein